MKRLIAAFIGMTLFLGARVGIRHRNKHGTDGIYHQWRRDQPQGVEFLYSDESDDLGKG